MIHSNDAVSLIGLYRELYFFHLVFPGMFRDVATGIREASTNNNSIHNTFTFIGTKVNVEHMHHLYNRGAFIHYIDYAFREYREPAHKIVFSYSTASLECANVLSSCIPGAAYIGVEFGDKFLRNLHAVFRNLQLGHCAPQPDI